MFKYLIIVVIVLFIIGFTAQYYDKLKNFDKKWSPLKELCLILLCCLFLLLVFYIIVPLQDMSLFVFIIPFSFIALFYVLDMILASKIKNRKQLFIIQNIISLLLIVVALDLSGILTIFNLSLFYEKLF